ncbi:MFS transporter [Sphingobium nicotianae]|uniref:MFS transporter n=1 Tax=Sphingobium nicotianae TaxID=2782607 RepID=A0A9X1DBQ2_9SPHN|nr:MFS transporter [Sphingobium nicotianae]MBT2186984.1 MFS transporter [Sphingobium nicotianae]
MDVASSFTTRRSGGYQVLLVCLLSLNFGIVFFDRNALNFLMPFVQPELRLNNTQVGLLASALSLSWALAAFGIGKLSDTLGSRKRLLVMATVAFSLCSFMTGIAGTFALLLGARLLMGAAEGGIMPISHAMIASDVAPERRGIAQGVAQNLGSSLLGSFAAPVLLVWFAEAFGWRSAFYLAGAPGILSAMLIWFLIDEPVAPPRAVPGVQERTHRTLDILLQRNVWVCVVLGVLLVSYLVICWAFMPIYLTQVRGYSPEVMGWLMGTLGISAAVASFVVAGLSDRIGRRPVMIVMPFVGIILPLAALYFQGPAWAMAALFFIGWSLNGIFPMFMATVPSESVDPYHVATALGLTMGVAEVLGGVFAPSLAGMAADATNLSAPLWIMFGLTIASGLIAMFLIETAPSQVAKKAG